MDARKWHLVVLPAVLDGNQFKLQNGMDQILIQVVTILRDPNRKQMSTLQRKRSRTSVSTCESKRDEFVRKIQDESDDEIIDQMSEQYDQLKATKSQNWQNLI